MPFGIRFASGSAAAAGGSVVGPGSFAPISLPTSRRMVSLDFASSRRRLLLVHVLKLDEVTAAPYISAPRADRASATRRERLRRRRLRGIAGDDAQRVHAVRARDVGELREVHFDGAALAAAVHIMK